MLTIRQHDLESQTPLNDADLSRRDHQVSKLGADVEAAELRHDEHVSVVVAERLLVHRRVAEVHVDRESRLLHGGSGSGDRLEALDKVDFVRRPRELEWLPGDLGRRNGHFRVER